MSVQRVQQLGGEVTEILLHAEAKKLVLGDKAGVIDIWDLDRPNVPLHSIEPECAPSIDGLAWLHRKNGFIVAGEHGIELWTLEGVLLNSMLDFPTPPQTVMTMGNELALVACESMLHLVDLEKAVTLAQVEVGERNTGLAMHPSGTHAYLTSCDQGGSRVLLVRADSNRVHADELLSLGVDHLSRPAISRNGAMFATAGNDWRLFSTKSCRRVATYKPNGQKPIVQWATGFLVEEFWTQCVALGDSQLACASPTGQVLIYDTEEKKLSDIYKDLAKPAVALGADGPVLAASGMDAVTTIWWPN